MSIFGKNRHLRTYPLLGVFIQHLCIKSFTKISDIAVTTRYPLHIRRTSYKTQMEIILLGIKEI